MKQKLTPYAEKLVRRHDARLLAKSSLDEDTDLTMEEEIAEDFALAGSCQRDYVFSSVEEVLNKPPYDS